MTAVFAIALLFAANSAAATPESVDLPAAKPIKKDKPKKICKTNAKGTGTRISRPVCKTEEEWAGGESGQEVGLRSKGGRTDLENVGGLNQP